MRLERCRARRSDAAVRALVHLWLSALVTPVRAFESLRAMPAPGTGLRAVVVRYAVTTLTTVLSLTLQVQPFRPSSLSFIPTESYYWYQLALLPAFGFVIWLLMASVAHLALRVGGRASDFDLVANVVGLAMLTPMPVVWAFDWAALGFGFYRIEVMAVSHSLFQLWETALQALGLRRVLGVPTGVAIALAVITNTLYVLIAATIAR